MSPRERVLAALDHRATDRVPTDFLATRETWSKLKRHFGMPPAEQVLRRLGVDLRHPAQPYIGPPLCVYSDGSREDAWGVTRQCVAHEGGAYQEIRRHPLADAGTIADLDAYPWPRAEWWDPAGLRIEPGYAIALKEFGDPGGMFEIAWYLRGLERFLMDLADRPEFAYEIMRRVTEFYLALLDRVMDAHGGSIDLVWTSDDIAHQQGRLVSERVWSELIAPHHRRLNRRIHERGARVMYHCCGAVRPFIGPLIDAGVDVLDAVQTSARGMEPAELKAEFGGRVSFHGGMDVQTTLPRGTPEEVRRVTRERIEVLGRGGGYILAPSHNIQVDTPIENILAMYDEAAR